MLPRYLFIFSGPSVGAGVLNELRTYPSGQARGKTWLRARDRWRAGGLWLVILQEMMTCALSFILVVLFCLKQAKHISGPQMVVLPHDTVSFHNFKSQNFKLSVSNPKSTYVAYLSVLSQISNCQSLGRKNKHDIWKLTVTWHALRHLIAWAGIGILAIIYPPLK